MLNINKSDINKQQYLTMDYIIALETGNIKLAKKLWNDSWNDDTFLLSVFPKYQQENYDYKKKAMKLYRNSYEYCYLLSTCLDNDNVDIFNHIVNNFLGLSVHKGINTFIKHILEYRSINVFFAFIDSKIAPNNWSNPQFYENKYHNIVECINNIYVYNIRKTIESFKAYSIMILMIITSKKVKYKINFYDIKHSISIMKSHNLRSYKLDVDHILEMVIGY